MSPTVISAAVNVYVMSPTVISAAVSVDVMSCEMIHILISPGGGCQGDGPKPTEQDPVGGLHPPPAVWLPVPPCVQHSPLRDTARPLHEASGEQGPVPGPLHDLPGVLHHEAQQYHRDDGEQGFYFVLPEAIMVHHEVQQYHQDNGKQRFYFVSCSTVPLRWW